MVRLPQQKNGASIGLVALLLSDTILACISVHLLATLDAITSAVPTLLHVGGVEYECATTVVYPHFELGNASSDGYKVVVEFTFGREHIWKVY